MKDFLSIKNVTFGYGSRTILEDVSLRFGSGQVVAIMGGSGMGKTTLLKLIGGLLTPQAGEICIAGCRVDTNDQSMARRVALARTIALDPALILYDEPFAGLDPISMGVTARLIRSLNDALGATSLMVTHDVEQTFEIADYVYMISSAKVAAQGTPAALRASDDPFVRQFINGLPDGPVHFQYPAPDYATDLGFPNHKGDQA